MAATAGGAPDVVVEDFHDTLNPAAQKAWAAIQEDNDDVEAWVNYFGEAQKAAIDLARLMCTEFLERFPYAGRYWKMYAELELSHGNHDKVVATFERSLLKCLSIDLWKMYLNYVETTKAGDKAAIDGAYKFFFQHMQLDPGSTYVWESYIRHIQAHPPATEWDRSQQMMEVRRAYQEAVGVPKQNIEMLWKKYATFEQDVNKLNKAVAKKALDQRSKAYMAARRAAREMDSYLRAINKNYLPRSSCATERDLKQRDAWRAILRWEKDNPMKTGEEVVVQRVDFIYKQFLMCYADDQSLWYESAMYLSEAADLAQQRGDTPSAQNLRKQTLERFRDGITHLPQAQLLSFAFADYLEEKSLRVEAKAVYDTLLAKSKGDCTLVYVQYMKYLRRTEDISAVRGLFKQGRKDPRCGFQLFIANARIERVNGSNGAKVCNNIFEHGLKTFGGEPEYILNYIEFLTNSSETNNIRVLFERVLSSALPADKAQEIWDKFLEFEYLHGDLGSVQKLEIRKETVYPDSIDSILKLVNRYAFHGLYPCTDDELKLYGFKAKKIATTSGQDAEEKVEVTFRPDVSQMRTIQPFSNLKPSVACPRAAYDVLKVIPPPSSYGGPKVNVPAMMRQLAQKFIKPAVTKDEEGINNHKRALEDDHQAPANDLFRQRQRAKLGPTT